MSTHQARIETERQALIAAAQVTSTAHVSPSGIATVRDASGTMRAAKLTREQLVELEAECQAALRRFA